MTSGKCIEAGIHWECITMLDEFSLAGHQKRAIAAVRVSATLVVA